MSLYSDITFWLAFVFFLAIYALIRQWNRVGMLLYVVVFNLLFFWLSNGWQMLLLPVVAGITWWVGRVLLAEAEEEDLWLRKLTLGISIVVSLLPLIYFKYSVFFLQTANEILASNFSVGSLALPVGISFFTFQSISYVVDVYRRRFTLSVSFLEYFFYLSFFPLLLSGPITRAETLIPQLRRSNRVSERCLYVGLWLLMLGVLKKFAIADYLAQFNNWVFDDPYSYSGFEGLMAILGFSSQIYCDFSGYSDISIGIAAMMGFHLRDNFNFPYRAQNLSDFWRRWHISLSSWFRDYLYIPLGGNRCGRARTYFNCLLTMLAAGFWHGASWMFILWGGLHGAALIVQKFFQSLLWRTSKNGLLTAGGRILTFLFVTFAWVFFRSSSVHVACGLLKHSIVDFSIDYFLPFVQTRSWWCVMLVLPILAQCISDRTFIRLQTRYVCLPWIIKLLLFVAAIQLTLQFQSSNVQPFIYSQF